MQARPGDWLLIKSHNDSVHARRAAILEVSDGGAPPYTVRWTDTGREGLVFPGPDAEVVTAERQLELDRLENEREDRVQAEIAAGHHPLGVR